MRSVQSNISFIYDAHVLVKFFFFVSNLLQAYLRACFVMCALMLFLVFYLARWGHSVYSFITSFSGAFFLYICFLFSGINYIFIRT